MTAPVNRYKQLVAMVPSGSFYASAGQVLPHKSTPYALNFTVDPSSTYSVYLNDVATGSTTSDVNGIATVNVLLDIGDNTIKLVNASDITDISIAYVTTRAYATWMAASADEIESADIDIEGIYSDSHLATVSGGMIDTVFGQSVATPNLFGYDLDAYRNVLQELRQAYRFYGATRRGIESVVRAYFQVSPLVFDHQDGPCWVLGDDFLRGVGGLASRTLYSTSTLPNANALAAGNLTITGIAPDTGYIASGTLTVLGGASPKRVGWNAGFGIGSYVQITAPGTYTAYGKDEFAEVYSVPSSGGFDIGAGANVLHISMDDRAELAITLTPGLQSAATIVAAINAAFNASPAYGFPWSTAATVHNPYAQPSLEMFKIKPVVGPIRIRSLTGDGAEQTLFGLPYVRAGVRAGILAGVTTIPLRLDANMNIWPDASTASPFQIKLGGATFHPNGLNSAVSFNTAELCNVVAVDRVLNTLTVSSPTVYAHNINEAVSLNGTDMFERSARSNCRGITFTVADLADLPSVTTTDSVTINGTGLPNGWFNLNGVTPVTPSVTPKTRLFSDTQFLPFDISAGTTLTIPLNADVLNWRGFKIDFTLWGSYDFAKFVTYDIASMEVTFDGVTYTTLTHALHYGDDCAALPAPNSYRATFAIPETATDVRVRITTMAGTEAFTVHNVTAVLNNKASMFLGDGTRPEGVQAGQNGAFMYYWVPVLAAEVLPSESQIGSILGTEGTVVNYGSHIAMIQPDITVINTYNVTDTDGSTLFNIRGVVTDTQLLTGTYTNMELVPLTPVRYSHMVPTTVSIRTEAVLFNGSSPYIATLSAQSTMNMLKAVLLEDGVPVTQDLWVFNSPTQIELLYAPVGSYEFTYEVQIEYVTPVIDLLATNTDYVWYADWHVFSRPKITPVTRRVTTGLQFDGTGNASLPDRSTMNKATASLTRDDGLNTLNVIPISRWNFTGPDTINMSLNLLDINSIYQLEYDAESMVPSDLVTTTVSLRDAASSGAVSAATYRNVVRNQQVTVGRYIQLRARFTDVSDTRDFRLQSLLLKGLPLFNNDVLPVLK
jgi:hypothetical protein